MPKADPWILKVYRSTSSDSGKLRSCSGSLSKTTEGTAYFELRGSLTSELLATLQLSSLVRVIDCSNPQLRLADDARSKREKRRLLEETEA